MPINAKTKAVGALNHGWGGVARVEFRGGNACGTANSTL